MGGLGISLAAAFGAGLFSFASPCVLPLVPAYLCFLSGASLEDLEESGGNRRVMAAAAAFVLGFTLVFVALGASATAIGALLASAMRWLAPAAGAAIVLLGLHYCGLLRLGWLNREARLEVRTLPGPLGAFIVGLAFAFGWSPCVGPVLAAILMIAAGKEPSAGIALLAAYGAGLGLPFLAAAAAAGRLSAALRRIKRHIRVLQLAMGGLLMVTGVLILTGGIATVGEWLLDAVPALGAIG